MYFLLQYKGKEREWNKNSLEIWNYKNKSKTYYFWGKKEFIFK